MKLNAKSAEAMLPEGRIDHFIWDGDLSGFGLRLRAGGHRSWVVQYRTASGRTRRVSLGSVTKLSAAQARDAARQILAKVLLGRDPQGEREEARRETAGTFRATVDIYLAARKPELRPASYRAAKLYLAGPYFQSLHVMPLTTIRRADVAASIRGITHKHSGPTAVAARRALSALFSWAIADGLLGDGGNPVDGSHRPEDPKPRDHVLTDAELVAIWNAVGCDDDYGRVLRLLILTAARASEVGGMRWSELNLGPPAAWMLPSERSKNHHAHTIALSPAALAILQAVPRTERAHLFGGRAGAGFTSWPWHKQELDRRLGDTVRPWRVHDVRRSVATKMADLGAAPHTVENVLGHYRQTTATTYNRSRYDREVAAALLLWSEHLAALVEGRDVANNVVPLRA